MLNKFLTTLKLIHIALAISLGMFGAVIYFVFFGEGSTAGALVEVPKYVLMAALTVILLSWVFSSKMLKKGSDVPLDKRVLAWYNFRIVRCALLESIGMFGVIATIFTGDPTFFVAPVFIAAILVISIPNEARLQLELGLSHDEMEQAKKLNT